MGSKGLISTRLKRFLAAGNLLLMTLLGGCKMPPGLMDVAPGLLTPTALVEIQPENINTAIPATPTLPAMIRLAISPADISGTWTYGGSYVRFESNGKLVQADTLDRLSSAPFAVSTYKFSGTTITILEDICQGRSKLRIKSGQLRGAHAGKRRYPDRRSQRPLLPEGAGIRWSLRPGAAVD